MLTVLDLGVRGGPHPRWSPFAATVSVIGIDADRRECERLAREASPVPITYLAYAVGEHDYEAATLHVTAEPGSSSLFPPNTQFVAAFPFGRRALQVVDTVPVTLTSLDTICRTHQINPDVIKIDTQGTELAILRGGAHAVARACLIELEVEFNPQYVGQPLFSDVDHHMRANGFTLIGLRRSFWRRTSEGPASGGTIMHGDVLYVKEPPADRRADFITGLLAYRQYDWVRALGGAIPSHLPTWRGGVHAFYQLFNRPIYKLFKRPHSAWRAAVDDIRPAGIDWHDPDFF